MGECFWRKLEIPNIKFTLLTPPLQTESPDQILLTKKLIRISHSTAGQIVKAYESKLRDLGADFIVIQKPHGLMSAALIGICLDLSVFSISGSMQDRNLQWLSAPRNLLGTALLVDDFVASGEKMRLAKNFLESQGLDVKTFSLFYDSDASDFVPDVSQGLRDAVIFDWLAGQSTTPSSGHVLADTNFRYGAEIDGVIVPISRVISVGDDQRDFLNNRDSLLPIPFEGSFGCSLSDMTLITSRSVGERQRTVSWLALHGLTFAKLAQRNPLEFGVSPIEKSLHKASVIAQERIDVFYESDALQAELIGQLCKNVRVILVRAH